MGSIWPTPERTCSSVFQCFMTILALGPRSSGSIGDVMIITSYARENHPRYFMRWIYDLAVFLIVNVIGMTVLFGIVLDTFNRTPIWDRA